jgi:hypothetical protein
MMRKVLKILSLLLLMMIKSRNGDKKTQKTRGLMLVKKSKMRLKLDRMQKSLSRILRLKGQLVLESLRSIRKIENSMVSLEATEAVSKEEETTEVDREAEAKEAHTEVATKMDKESRDPTTTEEGKIDLTDQDPLDLNPKSTSLQKMNHGTSSKRDIL